MKKIIFSILLQALPLLAKAYNIAVKNNDGVTIFYNYINDGEELEVTFGDIHYSGTVIIPEEIAYNEKTLKVTSIGGDAFRECYALTSVIIPNSVNNIGSFAFFYCSMLTSITIPNSVTTIGFRSFRYCTGLSTIIIPNSVIIIEKGAFEYCNNLTSVSIPNSVTSIGDGVFFGCSNLTSIISLVENPFAIEGKMSDNRVFPFEAYDNATLYIPEGTIEKYRNTDGWKDFIFMEEGTGPKEQCEKPKIYYNKGELIFESGTEGATCVSTISDTDMRTYSSNKVQLSATYNISVYATKPGYKDSDIATATLVWTEAIFTETTEPSTSAKAVTESIPVLISANGGVITVKSEVDGQKVEAYAVNGQALGSATIQNGQATIATNMQRGEIVIVKVGGRSVKVKM